MSHQWAIEAAVFGRDVNEAVVKCWLAPVFSKRRLAACRRYPGIHGEVKMIESAFLAEIESTKEMLKAAGATRIHRFEGVWRWASDRQPIHDSQLCYADPAPPAVNP